MEAPEGHKEGVMKTGSWKVREMPCGEAVRMSECEMPRSKLRGIIA